MSGLGHIMRTCFNLLVSYLASVSEERQLICAWNDCFLYIHAIPDC